MAVAAILKPLSFPLGSSAEASNCETARGQTEGNRMTVARRQNKTASRSWKCCNCSSWQSVVLAVSVWLDYDEALYRRYTEPWFIHKPSFQPLYSDAENNFHIDILKHLQQLGQNNLLSFLRNTVLGGKEPQEKTRTERQKEINKNWVNTRTEACEVKKEKVGQVLENSVLQIYWSLSIILHRSIIYYWRLSMKNKRKTFYYILTGDECQETVTLSARHHEKGTGTPFKCERLHLYFSFVHRAYLF